MPMPTIPIPEFPDVPALPGVPPVLRDPLAEVDPLRLAGQLLTCDLLGILNDALRPVWGIFNKAGKRVISADTVTTLEYRGDSRVSDYPQEQGAFASYNKVQIPYEARVQLICGRLVPFRAKFLDQIEAAKQSTDLYKIVTPERVYTNANVVAYDTRREVKDGATLVKVNVHIEEIRVTAAAQFSNTQNPASANTASQGQVQPQAPSTEQSALIGSKGA